MRKSRRIGRWLAYGSNESGQGEVYVRPFPDVEKGRWQISTGGGTRPLWGRNGRELFYVSPAGALMSVPVEVGPAFRADTPVKLFEGRYFVGGGLEESGRTYDVSADGRRFLMIKPGDGSGETLASPSIIVVQNWFEEPKRLAPAN